MNQEPFIRCVARACYARYEELSDFCFIFPNRRSATFFLKELGKIAGHDTLIAPDAMAVGDFMSKVSGVEVAPRVVQLMELYRVYCEERRRKPDFNSDDDLLDFDRFVPFGEIVLSDFSELDMYDVDTSRLFKNIADYNRLSSNYIGEERQRLLEEFFHYSPRSEDERSMWKNFDRTSDDDLMKKRFLELWQILPQLYSGVKERLANLSDVSGSACGYPMSIAGSVYREAMRIVCEQGVTGLPWKRVIVVGLDEISNTEREIFRTLIKCEAEDGGRAIEFFWDMAPGVFGRLDPSVGARVAANIKEFPSPEWAAPYLAEADRQGLPTSITEIGVPGNVMQVKVAGGLVDDMIRKSGVEDIEKARVAIVLPDEELLLPLLHSMPYAENPDEQGLRSVNLTMGWSMKYTAVASFVYHLERIFRRCVKEEEGTFSYLSEDVRLLIGQPLVQILIGVDSALEINTWFDRSHRRVVTGAELGRFSQPLETLLDPRGLSSTAQYVAWLDERMLEMDACLAHPDGDAEEKPGNILPVNVSIERMMIQHYRIALNQIAAVSRATGVEMRFETLFHILSRIVGGEKITFEGKPLKGLQVMGLLETRALDFDRIIVLSMNDKVMPSQARKRSFILESMRRAYDMPGLMAEENKYSYWFYRLLSRAREVSLLYDSRVGEGMRSGGKSRFLMQLEKLYDRDNITIEKRNFSISTVELVREEIVKDESVLRELDKFRYPDGVKNLSASALNNYLTCGLKFYHRYILGYYDDPEPSDSLNPITRGLIFHDLAHDVYLSPDDRSFYPQGKLITAADINRWLNDEEALRKLTFAAVEREYFRYSDEVGRKKLTPSIQQNAEYIMEQIRDLLRHDLARAPFLLYGGEVKDKCEWKVNENLSVNMTASFDRIDEYEGHLRVVDFKTGSVHLEFKSLEDVWNGEYAAGNILQLLLYASMLRDRAVKDGVPPAKLEDGIALAIFRANGLENNTGVSVPRWKPGGGVRGRNASNSNDPLFQNFREELNKRVIEEIFDKDVPFRPAKDPAVCSRCPLSMYCGRISG